jgi:undecaprenyl-diphosphatase
MTPDVVAPATAPHQRFRRSRHGVAEARQLLTEVRFTPLTAGIATATMAVIVAVVVHVTHFQADLSAANVSWWWIGAAAIIAYGQYAGYAVSLQAAAGTRLPHVRTLQLEVAESATTMATPESIGSLALTLRFLRNQGLEIPQAAAACGLSAFVTTCSGAVIIPVAGILAAGTIDVHQLESDVPSGGWELILAVVVVAGLVTAAIRAPRFRTAVVAWFAKAGAYLEEILSHPARGVVIVAGELVTVGCQTACMVFVLLALGAPVHVAAVVVVAQLAGAASNVVPVPGGLGAPEAILIAGLAAMGVHHDQAILAGLFYRLMTYWTPTVPGAFLLVQLFRADLV